MKIPTNPIKKTTLIVGVTLLVAACVELASAGNHTIAAILGIAGGFNLLAGAILKGY